MKKNILSNLDAIISIVVSLIAVAYGIFGQEIDLSILLAAIAAILAVISFGMIQDRNQRAKLLSELKKIEDRPKGLIKFRRRNEFTPLSEVVKGAKEISFMGISLVNILISIGNELKEKVQHDNAKVSLIFIDPNTNSIDGTAFFLKKYKGHKDEESLGEKLKRDLQYTVKKLEELGDHGFFIKMIEALPGYSMVLIDVEEEHGKIIVEFHTFHTKINERPHILLSKKENPEWYEFFKNQFYRIINV